MGKHERYVETAENGDESDGFLAKLKKGVWKVFPWAVAFGVILAAI